MLCPFCHKGELLQFVQSAIDRKVTSYSMNIGGTVTDRKDILVERPTGKIETVYRCTGCGRTVGMNDLPLGELGENK
jgi:ribosomal protein L44E